MSTRPLGRRTPPDFEHVAKYPLSALPTAEQPIGVPVVIGINWYSDFDTPVKDSSGRWWIARNGIKGRIRGGHCVCLKSSHQIDLIAWQIFYNQLNEGACVGFGSSRAMTLLNRKRYDARWLWDWAKTGDDWPDTNPGDDNGTSVRAAMAVLANKGHVPWKSSYAGAAWQVRDQEPPLAAEGISAYRWATSVDEVRRVLDSPLQEKLQAVCILNSWGISYPHAVWCPYDVLARLLAEDGEIALITDR